MAHQHKQGHGHGQGHRHGQGHGNGHSDYDIDWAEHAEYLSETARNYAAWYADQAAMLVSKDDTLLADVGCGGAGMAAAMARAASPGAEVVAIDGDEMVLAAAAETLSSAGLTGEIRTARADIAEGRDAVASALGGEASIIWASAVVHHAGDQQAAIDSLAGLLAPGGRLALAEGGLGPMHLPRDAGVGSPGLEQRLVAAHDRWFDGMRAELDASVPMPYGWTTALKRAGLTDVTTRTSLIERPPPLDDRDTAHVLDRLAHWVERLSVTELLESEDIAAWNRLLDEDDAAWLGHRDDLYVLEARSIHIGTRPARP